MITKFFLLKKALTWLENNFTVAKKLIFKLKIDQNWSEADLFFAKIHFCSLFSRVFQVSIKTHSFQVRRKVYWTVRPWRTSRSSTSKTCSNKSTFSSSNATTCVNSWTWTACSPRSSTTRRAASWRLKCGVWASKRAAWRDPCARRTLKKRKFSNSWTNPKVIFQFFSSSDLILFVIKFGV